MMNIRDQQVRVHCGQEEDANVLQYDHPNPLIPYSRLSCLGIQGISRLHFLLWDRLLRVGVCLWASGIYGAITRLIKNLQKVESTLQVMAHTMFRM